MERLHRLKNFASGLLVGVFLCLGLFSGLLYAFLQHGLTAEIDVATVAQQVREAIEWQVAELVPVIIDDIKEEIPERVATDLANKLATASFVVYGVEVNVPEETLALIREQVQNTVVTELNRSLEQIDVAGAAQQWGQRGEDLVAEALRRELRGRKMVVQVHPDLAWPAVPVVLNLQP